MSTEDDIPVRNEQKKKKKKNSRYRSLKSIYEEEEKKKSTSPISKKKKKSLVRSLMSIYEEDKEKKNTLPPTKEDEEKKQPIPVYELSFDFLKSYPDDVVESEEETLGDRERPAEYDFGGCKFVINQDELTYTRVRHPLKVYCKSHELRSGSVLHNLNYPVSTVSKKALDRYNAIEGTNYEYVGLVKAYKKPVDGFHYTLRFKARLPDQDPIYFQAMVWQRIPDKLNL